MNSSDAQPEVEPPDLETTKTVVENSRDIVPEKVDEETLVLNWQRSHGGSPLSQLDPERTYRVSKPEKDEFKLPEQPYEFLEELGRGGMGFVHKAKQKRLQRDVAIKRLNPNSLNSENLRAFLSEAYITAILDHPNIVPVYDMWRENGELFLAMKVVEGESWRDHLKRRSPNDFGALRDIQRLNVVCNAIAFAHSKNIIHCDLKPDNVMLGAFEEILVMDWGIALQLRGEEESRYKGLRSPEDVTGPFGTPRYMSPELANGDSAKIGKATDIYLLGAILHEILVGQPPHSGNNFMAVLLSACTSATPDFPDSVPEELGAICRKALAKKPEDRFQSVEAFQAALADYLTHEESARMAARGLQAYRACMRTLETIESPSKSDWALIYQQFGDATDRLREAIQNWPENQLAQDHLETALCDYASCALENGDLLLAETQLTQLPDSHEEKEPLREALEDERRRIKRQKLMTALTQIGFFGALAVIVIGLGIFVYILTGALEKTEEAQREEAEAKLEALSKAEEALNNLARAYESKGDQLLERGEVISARQNYAKGIEARDSKALRLKYGSTFAFGGQLLFQMGQFEDFENYFKLILNPRIAQQIDEFQKAQARFLAASQATASLSSDGRYLVFRRFVPVDPKTPQKQWDNLFEAREQFEVLDLGEQKVHKIIAVDRASKQVTCWHPSKPLLAYIESPGVVKVWDAQTGATVFSKRINEPLIQRLLWSPNGRFLGCLGNDWAQVYEVKEKALVGRGRFEAQKKTEFFWRKEGLSFLNYSKGQVWLRALVKGREETQSFSVGQTEPRLMRVTNDGRFLAIYTKEGSLELWDCKQQRRTSVLSLPGGIVNLFWDELGSCLGVLDKNGRVQIFEQANLALRTSIQMNSEQSALLKQTYSLSTDEQRMQLSLGGDFLLVKHLGVIQVWSLKVDKNWRVINDHSGPPLSLKLSSDGQRLFSQSTGKIQIRDLIRDRLILQKPRTSINEPWSREFSVDDRIQFALNHKNGDLHDLKAQAISQLKVPISSVYHLSWSTGGDYLATMESTREQKTKLTLIELKTQKNLRRFKGASIALFPVWSPTRALCLLFNSKKIKVYDARKNIYLDQVPLDHSVVPAWLDSARYIYAKKGALVLRDWKAGKDVMEWPFEKRITLISPGHRDDQCLVRTAKGALFYFNWTSKTASQVAMKPRMYAVSNDGQTLVLHDREGELSLLNLKRGSKKVLFTLKENLRLQAQWSSDSRYLCLLAPKLSQGHSYLIDVKAEESLLSLPSPSLLSLDADFKKIAVSRGRRILVTSFEEFLRLFQRKSEDIVLESEGLREAKVFIPNALERAQSLKSK